MVSQAGTQPLTKKGLKTGCAANQKIKHGICEESEVKIVTWMHECWQHREGRNKPKPGGVIPRRERCRCREV